jgi:signal transduction histidine kinase/ligand-binding sensor domain-containing protein
VENDAGSTRAVTALAESPDGRIWAGTERGLFVLNRRGGGVSVMRHLPGDPESLASDAVRSIRVGPDGAVWVLTQEFGAASSTLHRLAPVNALRVAAGSTSSRRDARGLALSVAERIAGPPSLAIHVAANGRDIWASAGDRLDLSAPATIAGDGTPPEDSAFRRTIAPGMPGPATAFAEDHRGRLWIGTHDGLFVRDPSTGSDRARRVPTTASGGRGLTDEVTALSRDRSGALWVGTFGGALRLDSQPVGFDHIGHQPGDDRSLASGEVSAVHQDGSGAVWIGTYGSGLDQLDPRTGHVRHHRGGAPGGPCGDYIWSLTPSTNGVLWATAGNTLCHLDADGRFREYSLPGEASPAVAVRERRRLVPGGNAPSSDAETALLLGTAAGLFEFVPSSGTARRLLGRHDGFAGVVDSLLVGGNDDVWAASGGSGQLARVTSDGAVTIFRTGTEGIWDMHLGTSGDLWLATGSGLARFEPESGETTRIVDTSGPASRAGGRSPGSVYYSVLEDDEGRLWLGTSKGLVRVDPSGDEPRFRSFDVRSGVRNVEFNRHAGFRGADGRMFFGGMNGVTVFHPAEVLDDSYVPPVAVTAVRIGTGPTERTVNPFALGRLVLSPADSAIDFEFAALDFTRRAANQYAYRLDGIDGDWVTGHTRRFARYAGLPAGDYVFRVKASNADGIWDEEGIALPVTVLPAFWQTWWFRALAAAALAGALALAYRARVRHLIEIERMRLRIAGDLHDELGSELSGIALLSGMLRRGPHLDARDRERLGDIESGARRVLDGLRDAVWYIDPDHDTLGALARRMRSFAERALPGLQQEFMTNVFESGAPVGMDVRRDLFLVYKELVANVARHAGAARVSSRLSLQAESLVLEVEDDGAGFEPGRSFEGTGLRNVRRRAQRLGAFLVVESRPGHGTRIRLTMEAPRMRRAEDPPDSARGLPPA